MYFLHTIEEGEESEELQETAGEGQNEAEGIRKSRHETDSEAYKAALAYSEKEPISQDKRKSSSGLSPVAAKELRRPSDEANKRLSASPARNSRRSSSSTQTRSKRMNTSTPWSSRGMSSPAPRRSHRRSSSAPPSSSAPRNASRRRSAGRLSRPGVDDLPAPQWVINLMLDIEEATRHELTVE
ncbi:hypothetical protein KOW79_006786 [Hemibagrus wyckioides]|uniref:Uncharacterized protein n=1 Tax=Hemibagrus wyckioides TaxID=337641 RepID=A0A9D3NXX2_9TELE|nr:hypothetical protein KOW79_006786 [Hemibagrus wyckioides]